MNVNGTGRSDHLVGTSGNDTVNGRNGNDWIEGNGGNDVLIGGKGADTFVLRAGDGVDVVQDFNFQAGDRVMFDSSTGVYSGILHLGLLEDDLEFDNHLGTAHFRVDEVDYNGDGVADTQITMTSPYGDDSIILLGVAPDDLSGAALFGG